VLGGDDPERDITTWIPPAIRHVAEIGAGGGHYTTALARHLEPGANLTAIDPDPRAVAALTRRGLPAVRADGADLPFADDSLDTLF